MAVTESPAFGLLLRRHRRAAGMTQEELAERAGMSARGVGDLERGIRMPRRDTLRILLEALDLSPDEQARLQAAAVTRFSEDASSESLGPTGSYLGAVPLGRLVARRQEIRRVLAAIEAVVGGDGRLVLLTGEPGIGKTRVAQEAALEAARHGFLVVTGRCYEPDRDVPFHPFVEALTIAHAALPGKTRAEIPSRWPHLNALLPEDIVDLPEPARTSVGGLEGQQRLFRAVSGMFSAVSEEMPVAILLDDLHWADDASLKLLLHLARHTRSSRVLLLGIYRDVDVDARHPLERALVDLNRERLVERVVVNRLDKSGTAELIEETLGNVVDGLDGLAETVHHLTNGNPFFIQEVVHMLVSHGNLHEQDGRWQQSDMREILPPDTVRAAIQQRLERLPRETANVLREASVLGQTFGFDDLLALGGRREEDLDEALEAAVGTGLIRETGQAAYTFNHALTQQALYRDMSQHRRRRLHLAAGDSLARSPERMRVRRAAELAWHFRAGGNLEQAVAYSMLAGDRAESLFAYEEAQRHFRTVVDLISLPDWEPFEPTLRARALSRLGRVLDIGEHYDDALSVIEQAADLYHAQGDLESEVMSVAEIGWIHHNRRTDEQGVARITALIPALREEPPTPRRDRMMAILHTALARLYFGLGRYGDELDAAECAAEAAREVGDEEVLAVAEARRGAALMMLGRRDEARTTLEQAIVRAEATGNLGTMSVALDNLGELAAEDGEYLKSRHDLERAVSVAEQTGLPGRMGWTLVKLGRILFRMGEWQESRTSFERAVRLFEDADQSAVYPMLHLAQLDAWTEVSDRAVEELEAAIRSVENQDRWLYRHGIRVLAELDLVTGRPAAARDSLAALLEGSGRDDPQIVLLFSTLAWALLELDDMDGAESELADGLERARSRGHRVAELDLQRVRGMMLARRGQWAEARHSLDGVIEAVHRMPDPCREAYCRGDRAVLAECMGDEETAREQRDAALEISRRVGAALQARYIERLTAG